MSFKTVSSVVDFAQLDEQIIDFWQQDHTFEKSVESRPPDQQWKFLDGPPFVTGLPHYGSLLSSIPKDVFGRYWTMKGYRVRRVWGWDGHGLPVENKVEKELGVKSKKDIENVVGIEKFVQQSLYYVNQISAEWEWYITHIGRWVDFQHAYKTWDLSYMESVMWVFKQLYDKSLIYKGLRVSLYCPHCATPISNFEVAMDADNYQDVTEAADTYKYPLVDSPDTYLLAWSTTPWNKIVTPALAVNPRLTYVKVKQNDEYYILGKKALAMLVSDPYEIVEEFSGEQLLGKKFVPHYDYYSIEPNEKAFEVIGAGFVTEEEGTGIVTIAAYGEEDLSVMQQDNIHIELHVDDEGVIKQSVPKFAGMYYLEANYAVNEDLKKRNLLYHEEQLTHSVAHCWRCGTRLFYAPKDAWFVNVQRIKKELFANNEKINWFPKHFKHGRFAKSMEAAPDWNISRNRYWGSPIPVWQCHCGERFVPGSIQELEERSGQKVTDLHKPGIDTVTVKCVNCGGESRRVPEVLDSWIEAGSAAFAERHYPFDADISLEDFFPPDFVAEYTGQIRAWFYVVHVIATALLNSPGFKNVLVEGVLLGTDGRKMSKNYGNFPDPKQVMEKYGGDALRLYLLGSPIMKGEDINFSNDGVPETVRGFMLILWNCYKFFIDYANVYDWQNTNLDTETKSNILDRWVLAALEQTKQIVKKAYEHYDTITVVRTLRDFVVNDLSTWYIRRSRTRLDNESSAVDRQHTLQTLYQVLVDYTKLLAPVAPFVSEEIYKNLTAQESVHLSSYPEENSQYSDVSLLAQMKQLRLLVEMGHSKRKAANIKLRQPLTKYFYNAPEQLSPDLEKIMAEELNVKEIEYNKSSDNNPFGELDTNLTQQLRDEGELRDLIREVQNLRKQAGLTLKDRIKITAPRLPERDELKSLLLKQTNAVAVEEGKTLLINKV
ncbi:isoleucine--tRNA ligase [Patescibacteria group bacterium]|nr:isoleucine--tRNA ligase [Patescibacteria group bacterium]